jgi:hypothetical protein
MPSVGLGWSSGCGSAHFLDTDPRELASIPLPPQPVLVQAYIPGDELKIYVIGEHIVGMRKLSSSAGPVHRSSLCDDLLSG